ncbi:MAG TPA: mannonate dehydratase [Steroidobacteraceae bacterium]|nr:mannonate dehydratase [Steroidobacteraceae bacterium]
MAVFPYLEPNLKSAKQLGVDDIVFNGVPVAPLDYATLRDEVEKLDRLGLRLTVVEGSLPMDEIVAGTDGRDRQIEHFQRVLAAMGRLGVEVLCYNFMPQIGNDAMVLRTTYEAPARGGAQTSAFRLTDATSAMAPDVQPRISGEAMWDHLEYFLKRVIPAAEDAGVKLAMHPDDPPIASICGLNRILSSVGAFDRLVAMSPSPANGITLCQGCFLEMGADLSDMIRRFGSRIHFVHFRDVAGVTGDFVETFPDDGPTDFIPVFETFKEIGCDGPIRVDHVPRLAIEAGANDGYGFLGHAYATGYLKGLLESVYGKPAKDRWRNVPAESRARAYTSTKV